ncbi:MAG: hypothetical protein NG740_07685 [Omnitrophica bacterium]|nr:hypothetical protein [Candidatus Omnitrophota bacterium]
MLDTTVLTRDRMLFEGKAKSVFLPGATGEFEILEFHRPIISLLKEGHIIIDWKWNIPIKSGVVKVMKDQLVAIVEE